MSSSTSINNSQPKKTLISILIVLGIFVGNVLFAQILPGTPLITNYSIDDYQAGSHNWSAVQDKEGVLYFGNHFGVLAYNGTHWQLIAQPANKTLIRSLAIDSKGTIYAGCQNDFGFLQKGHNGQFAFVSLLNTVPEDDRNFSDVWRIVVTPEAVYFHTATRLFRYSQGEMSVLKAKNNFEYIAAINDKLYIAEKDLGLHLLNGDTLLSLPEAGLLRSRQVQFLLPLAKDNLLAGTLNDGLYVFDGKQVTRWETEAAAGLRENKIKSGYLMSNGNYAIGTIHNGLYVIDKEGKLVLHLNEEKGLQDNLVNYVKEDNTGNLWLATDNGIDFVEASSPFSYLDGKSGVSGSVYAVSVADNKMFAGSAKGLLFRPLQNILEADFEVFQNLSQPTWSITPIDNEIIVGNHSGTFSIRNSSLVQLTDYPGGWTYQLLENDDRYMIGGYYYGLLLFKKVNGFWQFSHRIERFDESSRVIGQANDGTIWIAHGYKGVFKVELDKSLRRAANVTFYDQSKGFPSNIFISVFKVRNEILFGTEKGIYHYDPATDSMKVHPHYKEIFGTNTHIRQLQEDEEGNTWFVAGDEKNDQTGILRFSHDGSFKLTYTPFQRLKGKHVPGFENFTFAGNNVLIGSKNGIIVLNKSTKANYTDEFQVVLHEVKTTGNDSLLYGTVFPQPGEAKTEVQERAPVLPYELNALSFSFSAPYYTEPDKIRYSYYLQGVDNDWSPWATSNSREYTNLREGAYSFRVKAMNVYGIESGVREYAFAVLPPWYRTTWAYGGYVLLAIITLLALNQWKNYRFKIERKKIRLEQLQQKRLEHAEKIKEKLEVENQIMNINKEKLEGELATNAVFLVQVNEKMISVRERLAELKKQSTPEIRKKLDNIIVEINKDIESEDAWKDFLRYFNQSHHDFLHRLHTAYPDLTSVDIKLCAFLRMNLSSKQIASLMNITLRGVEAGRLRIRKKLQLDPATNLTDFIVKF